VYNADSRRTQLTGLIAGTNDFRNTYTYDNLQRLTSLNQQQVTGGHTIAAKRANFVYDARSQVTKLTRYADASGTEFVANSFLSYDDIGRLKQLTHTMDATAPASGWGTNPLAGYQYTYDAASRIASINSFADGLTNYTLDNTNQLTAADHTGQTDESYSYDANGNRTMAGYSTGSNNQLSSDGTYNYTYDDEGNRLTKTKIATGEKEEYTWDHRNRLVKITFKNSGGTVTKTVDHSYDVFNQWIRRSVDADGPGPGAATDTFFSHENGQVNLQFDGSAASNLSHRYLWGRAVDQLLADEAVTSLSAPGSVQYPLGDHLGTLRDLASHNSITHVTSIDNHRRYDDYGNLVSESNAAIDQLFGYTGRAFDESTVLQNNLNRWYDSKTGRWTSEDPIGFAGRDTNLSRYVSNSPTMYNDPSGLEIPGPRYDPFRYPGSPPQRLSPAEQAYRRAMFNYTVALIREMLDEGNKLFSGPCAPKTTINWGRLSWAMFYFLNNYAHFNSWWVVDTNSYNFHAFLPLGWMPILIDADRFDDLASGLGRELLHESMHDYMQYGFQGDCAILGSVA
jgi:RHS repeat-associated protein